MVLIFELRLIHDGMWFMLINPGIIFALIFSFAASEQGTNTDTIYHKIILVILTNLIYWIPATFVTIKIIDKITDKFIRKNSKTAVP